MFRRLAASIDPDPSVSGPAVFDFHPMQLARYLEEVWQLRDTMLFPNPTGFDVPVDLQTQEADSGITLPGPTLAWKQLIYAYMVENTRAYEVFGRVIGEFAFGERLGTPTDATQRWLRTTEQLFYSDDAPFQIFTLMSWIRNDARATRRNTYQRMFGMDLNHGTDDGRPYPYPRAAAANTDFVATWEQFLREVWRGFENRNNQVGALPTDDRAIATLARQLDDMLGTRREGGNITREELVHTSAMSWVHLTLSWDSPIVEDLEAQAESPEDRLLKIGERVGLPAHSRSGAYFRLADNMALILRAIELSQFNTEITARTLYEDPPPGQPTDIRDAMLANISDWSIATGRDMKSRPVSIAPPQPTPIRPTAMPMAASVSTDGRISTTREVVPT